MTQSNDITPRRPVVLLVGVGLLSLVLYLTVFAFVLQKPLTLGELGAMLERKEALAEAAGPSKVIIVAGSNGRFSHSCEVISQMMGRPCVNMSLVASVSPQSMLQLVARHVGKGDVVYIPMEYNLLGYAETAPDATGPWLWRNDRSKLFAMGPKRSLYAAFSYDVRFAIEAVAEMALAKAGISRRTGAHTLNGFGDETSNTVEASVPFRAAITSMKWTLPPAPAVGGEAERAVADLVAVAKARGARVVGGLPTTFNDQPIPASHISAVEQLYRRAGADFVALDNASQYPRGAFFDTSDHLLIPAREDHSRRIVEALDSLGKPGIVGQEARRGGSAAEGFNNLQVRP